MPSKLVSINRMEIFRAGTWNGMDFTEEDLYSMERNFNLLQNVIRPKLKITHREDQESLAGLASYGDVSSVYTDKVGGEVRLYCNLERVPEEVASWMKEGRFAERSIELWLVKDIDGKTYRNVITAVSLLGSEIPAVAGLNPVLAKDRDGVKVVDITERGAVPVGMAVVAFKFDGTDHLEIKTDAPSSQKGGNSMDEIKKMQERIDHLEKEKKELELKMKDQAHATEVASLKLQFDAKQAEIAQLQSFKDKAEKLEKENKELREKAELAEKEQRKSAKAVFEQRINGILEKFKKAGKIVPAVEARAKELLLSLNDSAPIAKFSEKVEDKDVEVSYTQVQLFEAVLENLPKIVEFGERGEEIEDEDDDVESAGTPRKRKHGAETYSVRNESLAEKAKKIQERDKVTFAEALETASRELKAEGKKQ